MIFSAANLIMYPYENPLVDLEWEDNYGELPGARQNRPRMPQAAGTEEPLSFRGRTDSYFKVITGIYHIAFITLELLITDVFEMRSFLDSCLRQALEYQKY